MTRVSATRRAVLARLVTRSPRNHPGFTVIELLVTLAAIAILVATLLPSLRDASRAASDAASIANMHQHVQTLQMYASDSSDFLPYFTDPVANTTWVRCGGLVLRMRYFQACYFWHFALGDRYYGGLPPWRALLHPEYAAAFAVDTPSPTVTNYWYTQTALAEPRFWEYETREGPSQFRAGKLSSITFASSKGLLLESYSWRGAVPPERLRPGVAFADGSTRRIQFSRFLERYRDGAGPWGGNTLTYGVPVMHTMKGLRGRDVP